MIPTKTMNKLPANITRLYEILKSCRLCPHNCGVDRLAGQKGLCRSAEEVLISSANLHFSEEPPISGKRGSGTIFFTNCSLSCVFCQNYPISQLGHGNPLTIKKLAEKMLELEKKGAHNINFVTPTHYAAQMAKAVHTAREKGLNIPILYNSSGYDSVETLKLLEGIVDIYMPDAKYCDDKNSAKFSNAEHYWEANKKALKEMHRQSGLLKLNSEGLAVKGVIIRHLVLPGGLSGSETVLKFIAKEISKDTYLSLMSQYHGAHRSAEYPELKAKLTHKEYDKILELARELGFENGWRQEPDK